MERHFEGTFIVREAGPVAAGVLVTSVVGLGVLLAFGHHTDPGPVRPASAVTSAVPTPTTAPAGAPGCVMLCDEPPLPPVQDSSGCRLFCDLGMPLEFGGRS
ncbi:hypothetical protein [Nocardia jiangxiensis]|uniref:hypothetical protein n=1 Tax=Nocardia jiangxiensis TaxID=282685 RepID=UPI0002F8D257|nr:hypothetical protein [Nocardia jiangxiensis]